MSSRPVELTPGRLPTRLTAGGFLCAGGRVLIERRRDDARCYPGMYDSPGGHVEEGETPDQALIREMREELGIAVETFALVMVVDDVDAASGVLYRHFIYVITAWRGEVSAREGQPIAWVTPGEARRRSPWNEIAAASLDEVERRGWL